MVGKIIQEEASSRIYMVGEAELNVLKVFLSVSCWTCFQAQQMVPRREHTGSWSWVFCCFASCAIEMSLSKEVFVLCRGLVSRKHRQRAVTNLSQLPCCQVSRPFCWVFKVARQAGLYAIQRPTVFYQGTDFSKSFLRYPKARPFS